MAIRLRRSIADRETQFDNVNAKASLPDLIKSYNDMANKLGRIVVPTLRELIRAITNGSGDVLVRREGVDVGQEPAINLLEGYGVDITTTLDAVNGEIEVTPAVDVDELLEVPQQTTADLDIYLSAACGSDAYDGLSTSTPKLTWAAARALIPYRWLHTVRVHVAAGTYTIGDHFIGTHSVGPGGRLIVYADDAWDSTVFSTTLSFVAAASTTAAVIKTSGLTINAHQGTWITADDGAAVGQFRTIRNNTATDVVPCEAWDVLSGGAPAQNDTIRIIAPAVIFNTTEDYCCITQPSIGPTTAVPGTYPDYNDNRIVIRGVKFTGAFWFQFCASVQLKGVVLTPSNKVLAYRCVVEGGDPWAPEDDSCTGWAATDTTSTHSFGVEKENGSYMGYFVGKVRTAQGLITGGYLSEATVFDYGGRDITCRLLLNGQWMGGGIDLLLGTVTSSFGGSFCSLYYCNFVTSASVLATATQGGTLYISSTTTGASSGATTAQASKGGSIMFDGACTIGGGAGVFDIDIGDGAPTDNAYYAAAGDRVFYDGSRIERIA